MAAKAPAEAQFSFYDLAKHLVSIFLLFHAHLFMKLCLTNQFEQIGKFFGDGRVSSRSILRASVFNTIVVCLAFGLENFLFLPKSD